MREAEKKMSDILSQDVQVSDVVNKRLQDTYEIIKRRQEITGRKRTYKKNLRVAAAAMIVCCAERVCVGKERIFRGNVRKFDEEIHKCDSQGD